MADKTKDTAAEAKATDTTTPAVTEMTAAEAVTFVKRTIIIPPAKKGEEPTSKQVSIAEAEVLSFKDLGDRVCVVTVDGQKFYGDKAFVKAAK